MFQIPNSLLILEKIAKINFERNMEKTKGDF